MANAVPRPLLVECIPQRRGSLGWLDICCNPIHVPDTCNHRGVEPQGGKEDFERSLFLTIRPSGAISMMDHTILAAMLESRIKAAPAGSSLVGLPTPFPADQLTNDHIFLLIEEELAKENTNNGVGITSK